MSAFLTASILALLVAEAASARPYTCLTQKVADHTQPLPAFDVDTAVDDVAIREIIAGKLYVLGTVCFHRER